MTIAGPTNRGISSWFAPTGRWSRGRVPGRGGNEQHSQNQKETTFSSERHYCESSSLFSCPREEGIHSGPLTRTSQTP